LQSALRQLQPPRDPAAVSTCVACRSRLFLFSRILADKLELHPLAILFGILAGGELGGVIGVICFHPGDGHSQDHLAHLASLQSNSGRRLAVVEVMDAAV
jgi:hypothetical protein